MAKVVALMSMSLDGFVADANEGVAEMFDWYFSGDVEVPTASATMGMTFHVSAPSAPPTIVWSDRPIRSSSHRNAEVGSWARDGQLGWCVPRSARPRCSRRRSRLSSPHRQGRRREEEPLAI